MAGIFERSRGMCTISWSELMNIQTGRRGPHHKARIMIKTPRATNPHFVCSKMV